jgi:uncharacterized protein
MAPIPRFAGTSPRGGRFRLRLSTVGGEHGRRPGGGPAALFALLVLLFALPALAAPTFPPLTGRVVDDADVLSPQAEQQLTGELAQLEQSTGRQLVVVTLPSLQGYPIEDYGYQLGRAWGIGQKGEDNGALFIVAPNERKTRIEVGYGLEPVLTDALSSVILQQRVLPKFRAGDMQGGVVDGTRALVQQLELPDDQARANVAAAEKAPERGSGALAGVFALVVMFWVLASIAGAFGGRRRAGLGGAWWLLPLIFSAGGRRDRWGGGGWGGGGFGGGGFSGGGGSFGGGGSSGSW